MSRDRRRLDKEAIEYHYDLSNEFYQLFLDPLMLYTCAYYRTPDGSLEQAQQDKLDLVCRKLRLQPGERLLDIGCGWGSLAVWAAKYYGVTSLGVTLSSQQATYAQEWIAREGLGDVCRVDLRDYRDAASEEPFDKISAIGIIEHVGVANYPAYFAEVHDLLKPGGLFLNHGITRKRHWTWNPQWEFLVENVFPNGELMHVSYITERMEEQNLEVLDVESLRSHYARTCFHWAERLRANEEAAIELVGERTYRVWLLYLAASSVNFEQGEIGLYQVLTGRPDPAARALPSTRDDIYARDRATPLARAHG